MLQRHRWKGNIRELRNTVERLLIMTPGDTIDVDDLPRHRRGVDAGAARRPITEQASAPGTLREFKEVGRARVLVDKLRENNWNISKTAEVIGTPRSNLYKKLEQYSIIAGRRRVDRSASATSSSSTIRRSRPDDRSRSRASTCRRRERKVRTPQGSAPGNARSGQPRRKVAQKTYRSDSPLGLAQAGLRQDTASPP